MLVTCSFRLKHFRALKAVLRNATVGWFEQPRAPKRGPSTLYNLTYWRCTVVVPYLANPYCRRSKAWQNIWKQRDRIEDAVLVKEGSPAKLLEKEVERQQKKRKLKHQSDGTEPSLCFKLLEPEQRLLEKLAPGTQKAQREAMRILCTKKFARDMERTGTWLCTMPAEATKLTSDWFTSIQATRSARDHMIYLEELACTGYSNWQGSLAKGDANQRAVTLVFSIGNQLEAAKRCVPGFGAFGRGGGGFWARGGEHPGAGGGARAPARPGRQEQAAFQEGRAPGRLWRSQRQGRGEG